MAYTAVKIIFLPLENKGLNLIKSIKMKLKTCAETSKADSSYRLEERAGLTGCVVSHFVGTACGSSTVVAQKAKGSNGPRKEKLRPSACPWVLLQGAQGGPTHTHSHPHTGCAQPLSPQQVCTGAAGPGLQGDNHSATSWGL